MFNEPLRHADNILRFITTLIYYSNYHTVIHCRFFNLIHKLNVNKEQLTADAAKRSAAKRTTESGGGDARRSYMVPADLQLDLVECQCNAFVHVKPGSMELKNFVINS